jgi:hypothetical protein
MGAGMQSGPGYAGRMFRALFEAGINIELITTSEIRITCVIDEAQVPQGRPRPARRSSWRRQRRGPGRESV